LAIASLIRNNFAFKLKRNDRNVKQDNFQVLRETIMPSVLVELGFLTNKKEGRYLNSKKGQDQMGNAIIDAVLNYLGNLKLNTVTNTEVDGREVKAIEYKIQIASGKNKIATKSYNFKGLKQVERIPVGHFYKYYYGNTSDYNDVTKSLKIAKSKGYSSAFIVAYKNGEKISVQKAIKMQ
jgi:N-acetylmuramoyl-L-alanine amidase